MLRPSSAPKRTSGGIYPGSGIARGGQQGRSTTIHNGVGGAKAGGGVTAGASPSAPTPFTPFSPSGGAKAAPAPAGGGFLREYKMVNGKYTITLRHRSKMTPAELAKALASPLNKPKVPPAPGVQPAVDENGVTATPNLSPLTFKDSDYWQSFDQAQRDYRAQVDPLNAERAALTDTARYGGKTLYDVMFDEAKDRWTRDLRSARDQQAKANLLRSGRAQRDLLDLDGQLRQTNAGLSDQYGSGRLTALNTQIANHNAQFNDPSNGTLAAIARAAQARAIAKEQARIQATYGMAIDPAQFQFAQE